MANVNLYKLTGEVFKVQVEGKKEKAITNEVNITYREAERLGCVIAFGESQLMEWIYANRGIELDQLGKIAGELKTKIRNSQGDEKEQYKKELHESLFVDEIVQVEIKSKKLFNKISKGFTLNGQPYTYLVSKGKQTLTFIKEGLYQEFSEKLNGGKNVNVPINASKLSAYKSLAMTDSKKVSAPNKVIVVPEQEVRFQAEYTWVGEYDIEDRNEIVSRVVNDGASVISPELGMRWSQELGKDKMISAFQVRQMFTKGVQYVVDFQRYFQEQGITHITDAWGHEQSVQNVECILNASQVKLWSAYDSCEDWLANADKFGYGWRIGKYSKKSSSHKSNYQQLITYEDLTDNDIKELITPSVSHINKVQSSWEHQVLYLNGRDMDEDFEIGDANIATALMIEPRLAKDRFVRAKIMRNLRRTKKDMGTGSLLLEKESYFRIGLPDPLQLLQGMIGIENAQGSLQPNEIFCRAFNSGEEMLVFRSPMLVHENIAKVKNAHLNSEHEFLYEYLDDTVIVFNGLDMLPETLCGSDWDGDSFQITQNPVLMSKHKKSLPICCSNLGGGTKEIIVDEVPLLKAASIMCSSSIPSIGSVINDATAMFSVLSTLEKDSEDYLEMRNRLKHMVRISQSVIDCAKNGKYYHTPIEWLKGDDHLATQKRKPMFQMDKYDNKKADLNRLKDKINFLSLANFGMLFADLLKVEEDKLTANQIELIQLYNDNCNVFVHDNNTMNRIHEQVHTQLKVDSASIKIDKSTKERLQTSLTYEMGLVNELKQILTTYSEDVKEFKVNTKNTIIDAEERKQLNKTYITNRQDKLIEDIQALGNTEVVTNAFVDIVYSTSRFSEIMWSCVGEQIIENLLAKNNNIMKVIVKDDNGSIDYLGEKYTVIEKEMK